LYGPSALLNCTRQARLARISPLSVLPGDAEDDDAVRLGDALEDLRAPPGRSCSRYQGITEVATSSTAW
jgi:hypothetical protein